MNIETVKVFYVFACVALCLIVLSPTLMEFFSPPMGEKFSELWILGSNRMFAASPIAISANDLLTVYLGVGNHMEGLKHYIIYVKIRNQTEPFLNNAGLPSSLEPVFEYHVFLKNNETWEKEVSFSLEDVSFNGNLSRVSVLFFDGHSMVVDKVAAWDAEESGFFYQLFFELWMYDPVSGFEYNNRSVWLWLNMSRQL